MTPIVVSQLKNDRQSSHKEWSDDGGFGPLRKPSKITPPCLELLEGNWVVNHAPQTKTVETSWMIEVFWTIVFMTRVCLINDWTCISILIGIVPEG